MKIDAAYRKLTAYFLRRIFDWSSHWKQTIMSTPAPIPFLAKKLKRKQFASTGDAHIQGDLQITNQVIIGGDLLVDGNLEAEEVFCLGKLTVTGDRNPNTQM